MNATETKRTYKYYDFVMVAFVVILLTSNLIGAAKVCEWHGFTFGAGIFFFPLSYVFGDVMTEVYGYARARKIVWAGFAAMIYASFMAEIIIRMPPSPIWPNQAALETMFGSTWRIVVASLTAYFCGEFMNSYVMAKMKVKTEGKHLWMRTIGSTIVGEAVDSVIFYPIAFLGIWETPLVLKVLVGNYFLKVGWEVVMTPFTYKIVAFLKKSEHEDFFDRDTDFSPFNIKT
ncbi:MAG: queuosine precursor transporter [Bdellovibrionales bacterium]|nr:queuosine precursor transporter [Bdellovibrionales bacterium]